MTEDFFNKEMPGKGPFDQSKSRIPFDLIVDNSITTTSRIVAIAILSARQYFEINDIPDDWIRRGIGISDFKLQKALKELANTHWLK